MIFSKKLLKSMIIMAIATFSVAFTRPAATVELPANKTITLNLNNADVRDVFRLIAEQNNLNMVLSPEVHGSISMRLNNVKMTEALDVVLNSANAVIEMTDNIIYINPKRPTQAADESGTEEEEIKDKTVMEIFNVNYVNGSQLLEVIKDYLSPLGRAKLFLRSEGSSAAGSAGTGNTSNNSGSGSKQPLLLVTDLPEYLDKVRDILKRLDVETRQVMIDAKIVETTMTNTELLGADWNVGGSFAGAPFKMDSVLAEGGKILFGTLNLNDFSATYKRLAEDKSTNVLSNTKLVVLDGISANIHVGDTIPVGISTISGGGAGGTNMGTTSVQQWNVGITLDVTPTVLEKDIIKMIINPSVTDVKSFSTIGSGGSAPITSNRDMSTTVLVKSGETIVIGGLVKDNTVERKRKVPFFGDLPFLGGAFRRKDTDILKTNLIIFITAHLIEPKSGYASNNETAGQPKSLDEFLEYK